VKDGTWIAFQNPKAQAGKWFLLSSQAKQFSVEWRTKVIPKAQGKRVAKTEDFF
jgi:hypothetical protein